MLSPQLRNKVHQLWTMFWSAGMSNPLVAIEQITYLLFIRQLERLDLGRIKAGKPSIYYSEKKDGKTVDYGVCRWSDLKQHVDFELLNNTVFPWLRGLEAHLRAQADSDTDPLAGVTDRLKDAYFVLDKEKTATLTSAVQIIDELFRQLDERSANADIMGDIFEYLLGEISSSGKNGQFRTPRHIIRFMIELLDPPVGSRVLDPACGTGGFLVNTLLHWKKKRTDPETLRLEWDGTPHRLLPDPDFYKLNLNPCFHGFDNDRTMVRIAWMNLILHELEFPHIDQRDALSKRMDASESGSYDFILANPPFTGSVDESDLSDLTSRFPREKKGPITTKSELLFVWLMLDLLKPGGRCAVIVPDGVLFGGTNAHIALRRKLLFENQLEAVISLPAGVFQPYAGVKTSILVFQKVGEEAKAGQEPRTKDVWFYEVQDEAYSLDQRRKERPGQDNDLWDALEKFKTRDLSTTYHRPDYWKERWRVVDDEFLKIFPEEDSQKGQILGLQELFPQLPVNPDEALALLKKETEYGLNQLVANACIPLRNEIFERKPMPLAMTEDEISARYDKVTSSLWRNIVREAKTPLDREFGQHGITGLKQAFDEAVQRMRTRAIEDSPDLTNALDDEMLKSIRSLIHAFARLDGYDVTLRSIATKKTEKKTDAAPQLSWSVPVRAWAKFEDWGVPPEGEAHIEKPTHDEDGIVDPAYLAYLLKCGAFEDNGMVKDAFLARLAPTCLEASELSLPASRYKPIESNVGSHQDPTSLIEALDAVHATIRERLSVLKALIGTSS